MPMQDQAMKDLAELEARISAALDRIGRGLDRAPLAAAPGAPVPAGEDLASLRDALDEERMANAQLQERLKVLHAQDEARKAEVLSLAERLQSALAAREAEVQNLTDALAQASQELNTLRSAASAGAVNALQINRALLAEVEALNALRAQDAADLAAVIGEIEPLVTEAAQHA